jgi:NlpC/P60 family putative phage cell wall peptidase
MSVERSLIVSAARRWIGTPYLHQASLLHIGCDCLGLVRGVWRETVGEEPETAPPYTPEWAEALGLETVLDAAKRHFAQVSLGDCRAGDVLVFLFFFYIHSTHIGI